MYRVGVFRALVLGDMLCATPALRAIKAGLPGCELTLVGLPWAAELAERLPSVDRFLAFPGFPGLPEMAPRLAEIPAFIERMQAERFDLLVQLHGSGGVVNPLMGCCAAARTAGFVEPGAYCAEPDLHRPWPERGHEIERLLTLTDHLRMPRCGTHLQLPLDGRDLEALARVWPGVLHPAPYVCLHPGAQLASRRWPAERFVAVGHALVRQGWRVVLTGTDAERPVAAAVAAAIGKAAIDLAGRTSLWTLGAMVQRASLVVCNDTGISHVAAALGRPSVVISCGSDVTRWAPLDTSRHHVLWSPEPCRPCSFQACPYGHACAAHVRHEQVIAAALQLLSDSVKLPA